MESNKLRLRKPFLAVVDISSIRKKISKSELTSREVENVLSTGEIIDDLPITECVQEQLSEYGIYNWKLIAYNPKNYKAIFHTMKGA